jgi:hypothetical protein
MRDCCEADQRGSMAGSESTCDESVADGLDDLWRR